MKFDDSKSVRELIQSALDKFGYYEPFGTDSVTIFQSHHGNSNYGWFTLDTSKLCKDEIENSDEQCFAYHIPGFLYYAEGGWGHHMPQLGNHPVFSRPLSIKLKFEEFNHTVVFEGSHSFREVIDLFKRVGYIDANISKIKVHVLAYPSPNYIKYIDCGDAILDAPMSEFEKALPSDGTVTLNLDL